MLRSMFAGKVVLCAATLVVFNGCKSPSDSAKAKIETTASQPADPANVTQNQEPTAMPETKPVAGPAAKEPDYITVQHILISFKGSIPKPTVTRSKEEAEKLAKEILATAQSGERDFAALVREYTDDEFPGIYSMANNNVPKSSVPPGTYHRSGMVPAFGNTGFPMQVGEVGIANFDEKTSPYGWHIVKRIK